MNSKVLKYGFEGISFDVVQIDPQSEKFLKDSMLFINEIFQKYKKLLEIILFKKFCVLSYYNADDTILRDTIY